MENYKYYSFGQNRIKKENYLLWEKVCSIKNDIPFNQKFYLYENNLTEVPKCYCGNNLKFITIKKGYTQFCSKRCMYDSSEIKSKRILTNLKKWGVDNPAKNEKIKEKVKKTNNIKFGVDHPLQNLNILNKYKIDFIKKWGVDNPSKVKEIRLKATNTLLNNHGVHIPIYNDKIKNKILNTNITKWGVKNVLENEEVRRKVILTNIEKYGFKYPMMNDKVKEKSINTQITKYGKLYTKTNEFKEQKQYNQIKNWTSKTKLNILNIENNRIESKCNICESIFIIEFQLARKRVLENSSLCTKCNPIIKQVSESEKELLLFIKSIYKNEIIENYKDKLEIDIYLPELKIGFEYNGLYWHSEINKDKKYHKDKKEYFNNKGIQLFYIWEDHWIDKKEIVKSIIQNKLKSSKYKIWARKCQIKEVKDNKLIRSFLEKNHIQGFVGSKVKIGLFYENELVSLMTFGNLRKSLGNKSKESEWELLRFCNVINTNVVGSISKMLKYFKENYKTSKIYSFSYNDYSNGDVYYKLGFIELNNSDYNYYWIKDKQRYHRFNFRKDKLVKKGYDIKMTEKEIMYKLGYFRIFDSGNKKFVLN